MAECSHFYKRKISNSSKIYLYNTNIIYYLLNRVTTSLKIDPVLWKQAKHEAINYNLGLSELLEEAIVLWMKNKK